METKIKYIALDGAEFDSEAECVQYEDDLVWHGKLDLKNLSDFVEQRYKVLYEDKVGSCKADEETRLKHIINTYLARFMG